MALINKNQKVFVAGHKGMAGQAICRSLKNSGYHNLITVERNKLDLMKYSDVKEFLSLEKPEVVIIAAAKVGGIAANSKYPVDFLLNNLQIQNNLIELSFKEGVKRLLFLGSSCIYPKFSAQPIKEEELLTSHLEPTNQWYALAKISGIKLCESLYIQHGINAISLMPCNLFGPGDNYDLRESHVLPALIRKFETAKINNEKEVICWGTGQPLREFLYVDDLAEACIFALRNWDITSDDAPRDSSSNKLAWLNVGSGKEISIKDLSLKISNLVGYRGKIIWDKDKPDGTPRKLMDTSKIRSLGWSPKTSLTEGIKFAINDFKENFFK